MLVPTKRSVRVATFFARWAAVAATASWGVPWPRALGHATTGFDLLEQSPGLFRQLCGDLFHIPAAAGRIDHLVEMPLFLEHDLDIAGNTTGELVGRTENLVKGD